MGLLQEFTDYLNEQAAHHGIYVWGAQGQGYGTVTEAWIRARESNTGGYANGQTYADAAVSYWRKQCSAGYERVLRAFDCSGLGVYWLYNTKRLFSGDKNANGMMGTCKIVPFSQRKQGCWLFRVNSAGKATHIGYMVDDTNVVHAKGRAYGVTKETAKSSYWHRCGIPAVFASEIGAAGSADTDGSAKAPDGAFTRLLKYGSRGEDVKALKALLAKAGHTGLTLTNGNFYALTKAKVIAYQQEQGLEADGIAGERTITALGGDWAG